MSINIAGIPLTNNLMNAAYIGSKTVEDMEDLIGSASGAVVVGSITVKPRAKNPGQGYWKDPKGHYALNSYGMPNGGLPYFSANLPEIVRSAHVKYKPVIVNVAGFSNAEFVQLIRLAQDSGADMAELNLGCPNVWEGGRQKRILSYHPELIKELLEHLKKANPSIKLAVKLSPLPPDILNEVADVITKSRIVDAVVATNSYPNALASKTKETGRDQVLAGLTGGALKPISLGVVKQLSCILPDGIDIIGCGGISTADDVQDYIAAGAKAVQVATALVENGLKVFETLSKAGPYSNTYPPKN